MPSRASAVPAFRTITCDAWRYASSSGKPAVSENLDLPLEEAYRNAGTADAREGMSAFLGKRDPEWSHGRPRP